MNIVLVGGGDVGESIARELAQEHRVTVIEADEDRAEHLGYSFDVIGIAGDGTDSSVLLEADIDEADMLIAVTDDDETNVVAAGTAKALTDVFTIARIKDTKYLRTWERSPGAYGIDYLVATYLLTAETIARLVGLPTALDSDLFANGLVQMAEFQLSETSPIVGQQVKTVDTDGSLTFAAILRNGDVEVPHGGTTFDPTDRVVVIGSPESVHRFGREIAPEASPEADEEVVIVGGSVIGFHVARLLSERGFSPRLIERNQSRARELAEALPEVLVLHSDATDIGFLQSEHVGDADVLVSSLENDEKNLLEVLLAKKLGVKRTVATVDHPAYFELFEAVGLDVGINPRMQIAEEITRFTQAGNLENLAFIESDKAEVIEVEVAADSSHVDRSIEDLNAELPPGIVFGAITRDGEVIPPRGDTTLAAGDHLIAFAEISVADAFTDFFDGA